MIDIDKALEIVKAMNHEGVDYIVFGAVALAAHGLVRATEDVDFFVKPTRENIERVRRALRSLWNDPQIDEITDEDLLGDYPAVCYWPKGEDFNIDILTRLGEAYSYENLEWEEGQLEGVPIRVVTARMLYQMKRDTVRYKDRLDADRLRRTFGFGED